MKAQILDERKEHSGASCFLCKMMLEDYISGLPEDYQTYDIQREIVTNVYLDHLVETVLKCGHIPPIVLVVDETQYTKKGAVLNLKSFKILDGLQRTFRLQAIKKTITYCLDKIDTQKDYGSWSKFKFSREFSSDLNEFESNTFVLRPILDFYLQHGEDALLKTFSANPQWFEIWTGLGSDEEVRKMLTLNAGHKPVRTRHQLELIFLNLLPQLKKELKEFTLVREKEVSATQFAKTRESGTFHFAHIISSLLSIYEGVPITPSTGLIQGIQSNESGIEEYERYMSPRFLKDFLAFLVELDGLLARQYGSEGVTWMGREVSLAGLFGAIGAVAKEQNSEEPWNSCSTLMQRLLKTLRSKPSILDLSAFERARNSVDLSQVNIGKVNRDAIFRAVKDLLIAASPSPIKWKEYFKSEAL